jgi:hypothetical protein
VNAARGNARVLSVPFLPCAGDLGDTAAGKKSTAFTLPDKLVDILFLASMNSA